MYIPAPQTLGQYSCNPKSDGACRDCAPLGL